MKNSIQWQIKDVEEGIIMIALLESYIWLAMLWLFHNYLS